MQEFAAQHGALVIPQIEDYGTPVTEVVVEFDRAAEFIGEFEIPGNFCGEMLLDADKLESGGALICRRTHDATARHRASTRSRSLRKQVPSRKQQQENSDHRMRNVS